MWTSQVYGPPDKIDHPKTHRPSQNTKYTWTQQALRTNYFVNPTRYDVTPKSSKHIFFLSQNIERFLGNIFIVT